MTRYIFIMPMEFKIFTVVAAGLFGAAIGSFLNVCVYRLPRPGLRLSQPRRSFCPSCGGSIRWFDNLPLISWLCLGGRCRSCRAPIPWRYFVIEAITSFFFVLIAVRYLWVVPQSWGSFVVVSTLVAALIAASFIDLELRILPDEITVGGMALAPFVALAVPELYRVEPWLAWALHGLQPGFARAAEALGAAAMPVAVVLLTAGLAGAVLLVAGIWGYSRYWRLVHPQQPKRMRDGYLAGVLAGVVGAVLCACALRPDWLLSDRVYGLCAALLGMAAGSTLVFIVGELGTRVFRKPAMGFGDVKLMGLLGAVTGWLGVVAGFFIACLLGSAVGIVCLLRSGNRYLPFGPFLALGAVAMLLWPEALGEVLAWYLGLFRL